MKDGETQKKKKKRKRKKGKDFLLFDQSTEKKDKKKKKGGWIEFFPFQIREKMTLRIKIQNYPNSFFLLLMVSV